MNQTKSSHVLTEGVSIRGTTPRAAASVANGQPTLDSRRILCIGHRGAAGHEPENTLRSIRRALEMGADGVEVDVYLVEGELVVIHDHTLNRTTNGRGPLRHRTLAEIRALDAGKGERVPFLREVIETVNRRALLNIELKGPGTAGPVIELLREFTRQGWVAGDFLVSSFRRAELRAARGCGFPLGVLFGRSARLFRRIAHALDAWSIHVPLRHVNPGLVSRVHADGRRIFVYTVNERDQMERLREMGVDGFFTDYPDRWTATGGEAVTKSPIEKGGEPLFYMTCPPPAPERRATRT